MDMDGAGGRGITVRDKKEDPFVDGEQMRNVSREEEGWIRRTSRDVAREGNRYMHVEAG
jgi:uncharacterized protein YqfB (UPF0267 family)